MTVANVLGVIGYALTGSPIGYMVGAMIGAALFPEGGNGPRLEVGFTKSEYGRPLPIIYGTISVPGTVIASHTWVVEGDSGGKGDEPTPDVAYGSFAVALGEGGDDIALGHIWFGPEKRLVWDGLTFEGDATVTFYNGSEDQLPDPLMESFFGVGNVPAYRGTAYMVVSNFPLAKDGNRLPFVTAQVGRIDANVAPEDLGTVNIQQVLVLDDHYAVFYWGSYHGVVIRDKTDHTLYKHYTFDTSQWTSTDEWFYDGDREVLVKPVRHTLAYVTMPLATGVQTTHTISAAVGGEAQPGTLVKSGVYHNGDYIFGAAGSGGTLRTALYVMDPDTHEPTATYTSDLGGAFAGPLRAPIDASAYVYGFGSDSTLKRFALSAGVAPVDLGAPAPYVANNPGNYQVDPNTGYIWSITQPGSNNEAELHVNNPGTQSLIFSDTLESGVLTVAPFTFIEGIDSDPNTVIISAKYMFATDHFMTFNADTPGLLADEGGGYHGTSVLHAVLNTGTELVGIRFGGWMTFAPLDDPTQLNYLIEGSFNQEEDVMYLGEADATLTPNGQALSEVVLDLSLRAGLTADQVDVTALEDDIVDGYSITDQMSVRDAIAALMPVYYFDPVESEGKVKYVKRGGAATVIDDDDVGCFEQGADPADPMETTRLKENDLPRSLTVKYLLAATNYSVAAKLAKRLIGSSGEERTMECAMVLTDTKGQEVAEVNLHGAWVARLTYKFTLTRKWSHLEPTDVVIVYGYTMRLTKTVQKDGIIECEATAEDAPLYTPNVVVTETEPVDGGGVVGTPATIVLEIA